MKNQKLLTIAALAGLTLGGLSVTAASAQSYGGDPSTDPADTTIEAEAADGSGIVLVQDADGTDAPGADEQRSESEGRRGHRGGCDLEDAALAIGIDEADLRAAIDGGDTIADVAAANGVDVDTVVDAMVDAKAADTAEKVTEGRITQSEADEKLADAEARITEQVTGQEEAAQA